MKEGSVSAWWERVLRDASPDSWERTPERAEVRAAYEAFCRRARAEAVGADGLVGRLRSLMPERGFAACTRALPRPAGPVRDWEREIPGWTELLYLPPLDACRAAYRAATGAGPDEWRECGGGAEEGESDVSSVEAWWRWKLDSGISVPDETDPYGRDSLYWNTCAAADNLFASYRAFCERRGREPVRPGFFAELFAGLFPPMEVFRDRRILFRGRASGAEGRPDAARLERVPCYRLPPLRECRRMAAVRTGAEVPSPAADAPARSTPVTGAPDGDAVRLWWRWKLALGCIIPEDRYYPGRTADGPVYAWYSCLCASTLHGDWRDFCARHGREPVEAAAFLAELAPLLPSGIPADPAQDPVDIPPLAHCRAWFADNVAREAIAWPEMSGDEV